MENRRAILVVGVCTCRNPAGLTKLLTNLGKVSDARAPSCVIVVDNDPAGAGIEAAQKIAGDLPFRVVTVSEPRAGIPFARNRLIAAALNEDFDHLVMLDDDEYPAPGWLEALEAVAEASGADVVGGPVRPNFATPPEWPAIEADFAKEGGRVTRSGTLVFSTANVLVTRRLIEGWKDNWFRAEFAETGGSDTEFLRRTAKAGHRHAIASDAFVFEDIPADRARQGWLLRRCYRTGNILARVRKMQNGLFLVVVLESASMAVLLLRALFDFARAPTSARARFGAKMNLARAAGKLGGLAGIRYREYTPSRYRTAEERTIAPG